MAAKSSLAGQKVLIFGGSSGMGKAAAASVLEVGGSVTLIARDKSKLEAAAASLGTPDRVETASLDVTKEADIEAYFASLPDGSFHHIVATVGASAGASDITGKSGLAKLRQQFELKFFAQMVAVSYGASKLADGGSIVLTSGALSKRPGKGSAALAAANVALEAMGKALANDFGPRIRINTVSPGLVDTEMWIKLPEAVKAAMLEGFGKEIPAGRAGKPEDVGHAIRFLLENSWVTGTVLDVDGGAAIRP